MRKKIIGIALASVICLGLVYGCGPKEAVEEAKKNINPISEVNEEGDKVMGDTMPFFDGEKMNVYHLKQEAHVTNDALYHPIARLTTTDFVHYEEKGVALNFGDNSDSVDAALGTGSFIKDKQGNVHCFYTGHNATLTPVETIRHAVSSDNQETWVKDEDFKLINGDNDFRDPYLYYDEDTALYNMLVTTRANDKGVIWRYSASSLSATSAEWNNEGLFYVNPEDSYNMECPSYFSFSGFYYLMFSEQGNNRVTHYRYKKNLSDDWIIPDHDYIDGDGFYAGRPEQMDGNLYAFAWCAKTTTGDDTGEIDWGGNLVVHRLKQRKNGELYPVMVPNIASSVSKPVRYKLIAGQDLSLIEFKKDEFRAYATKEVLKDNVTRIKFTFNMSDPSGNFGLTFGLDDSAFDGYDNRLGNAVIAFDPQNNALSYYNNVYSIVLYRKPLITMPFNFEVGKDYTVEVLIDGEIITVYLDNTIALTTRIYSMPHNRFAFYSNGVGVTYKDVCIYE